MRVLLLAFAVTLGPGCFAPSLPDQPCADLDCTQPDAASDPPDASTLACTDAMTLQDTASGTEVVCALGCLSQPSPHCAAIAPSNGVPWNLTDGLALAPVSWTSGTVTVDANSGRVFVDSTLFRAEGVGYDVASNIGFSNHVLSDGRVAGVFAMPSWSTSGFATVTVTGTRPVVFLVRGDLSLGAPLNVSAAGGTDRNVAGPGGGYGASQSQVSGGCGQSDSLAGELNLIGGGSDGMGDPDANQAGGGGGGHATPGGEGGGAIDLRGLPGAICPATLEPLAGGGGGGRGASQFPTFEDRGGGGGGAIQISASGSITLNAHIIAAGAGGAGGHLGGGGSGGGAGGTILLEAMTIQPVGGSLFANGGGGGSSADGGTPGMAGENGTASTNGAKGGESAGASADGGDGGARSQPRQGQTNGGTVQVGGGGGGASGRIHVRTANGLVSLGITSPQFTVDALRIQ